jgi:hypothetical protein
MRNSRFSSAPPRALLFCVMLSFAGCSPSYQLETAEVRGTVTLDGVPLTSGGVMFLPSRGRGATGVISADGTYRLTTYNEGDGAIVGKHQVSVVPVYATNEFDPIPRADRPIPQRYQNGGSSGLVVDVKPGDVHMVDFKLTSKPVQPGEQR